MARKRVSSIDLSWMIYEKMREEIGAQRPLSVAVISDPALGWRAIVGGRSRKLPPSNAAARKLRSIENELRARYSLAVD
jgi:hypothetical protein